VARIYTRKGDDGTTGLIGGKRVSKDSAVIEACGALDELNAVIGVVRGHSMPDRIDRVLETVQESLFAVGAELASPDGVDPQSTVMGEGDVRMLEKEIDALEESLAPLRQFVLPGGTAAGAHLHLARAAARKSERRCVAVARNGRLNPAILVYLNRLSDLFFVMARYVNQQPIP
jgi:cob(I)alamin adenosyltransferase